MKKLLFILSTAIILFSLQGNASAFFIDFENGTDSMPVIGMPGLTFENLYGSIPEYGDTSTGNYATFSDDLGYGADDAKWHHNGNFFIFRGCNSFESSDGIKIDFQNNDGTWFTTGYSSTAGSPLYMEAWLTDGTTVVSQFGVVNEAAPLEFLSVNATGGQFIDYVIIRTENPGFDWLLDDMSGDASGVGTPEPATLMLFGIGITGLAVIYRKKAPKTLH